MIIEHNIEVGYGCMRRHDGRVISYFYTAPGTKYVTGYYRGFKRNRALIRILRKEGFDCLELARQKREKAATAAPTPAQTNR